MQPYPVSLKLKFSDQLSDKNAYGLTSNEGDGTVLVQISTEVAKEDLLNICIHEAVHVRQFVEEIIGENLDSESCAYLTAYVACWIWKKASK